MRYDTPVYFQLHAEGSYDATTGNYSDPEPTETKRYANVMDTRTSVMHLIYGAIKQGSLTIQLQQAYTDPFDAIRLGSHVYKVDFERRLREKHTLIVSEVQ